jgi:hypothetical protein
VFIPIEDIPVYDPTVDDSPAWLLVTCTRCGHSYQCTPFEDFMTPGPSLNWTYGGVCEPCLIGLARIAGLFDNGED